MNVQISNIRELRKCIRVEDEYISSNVGKTYEKRRRTIKFNNFFFKKISYDGYWNLKIDWTRIVHSSICVMCVRERARVFTDDLFEWKKSFEPCNEFDVYDKQPKNRYVFFISFSLVSRTQTSPPTGTAVRSADPFA